jgi:hypothetical protein
LRLLGKEVPDGGGGMAHGDCFVQGKALAPILGGQDVIARTLTSIHYVVLTSSGTSNTRLNEMSKKNGANQ